MPERNGLPVRSTAASVTSKPLATTATKASSLWSIRRKLSSSSLTSTFEPWRNSHNVHHHNNNHNHYYYSSRRRLLVRRLRIVLVLRFIIDAIMTLHLLLTAATRSSAVVFVPPTRRTWLASTLSSWSSSSLPRKASLRRFYGRIQIQAGSFQMEPLSRNSFFQSTPIRAASRRNFVTTTSTQQQQQPTTGGASKLASVSSQNNPRRRTQLIMLQKFMTTTPAAAAASRSSLGMLTLGSSLMDQRTVELMDLFRPLLNSRQLQKQQRQGRVSPRLSPRWKVPWRSSSSTSLPSPRICCSTSQQQQQQRRWQPFGFSSDSHKYYSCCYSTDTDKNHAISQADEQRRQQQHQQQLPENNDCNDPSTLLNPITTSHHQQQQQQAQQEDSKDHADQSVVPSKGHDRIPSNFWLWFLRGGGGFASSSSWPFSAHPSPLVPPTSSLQDQALEWAEELRRPDDDAGNADPNIDNHANHIQTEMVVNADDVVGVDHDTYHVSGTADPSASSSSSSSCRTDSKDMADEDDVSALTDLARLRKHRLKPDACSLMLGRFPVSISSICGWRHGMEDEFISYGDVCAVFDGHGGPAVSRYLRQNLYAHMQAALPQIIDSSGPPHTAKSCVSSSSDLETQEPLAPRLTTFSYNNTSDSPLASHPVTEESPTGSTPSTISPTATALQHHNLATSSTIVAASNPHFVARQQQQHKQHQQQQQLQQRRPTVEDYRMALKMALAKVDDDVKRIKHWSYQGSTAVAVWMHERKYGGGAPATSTTTASTDASTTTTTAAAATTPQWTLITANVGDSRAVLSRKAAAVALSRDHKPHDPAEWARIEAAGGTVVWHGSTNRRGQPIFNMGVYRVNGSLALSRAIGDHAERPAVCSEPDFTVVPILLDQDDFVVLATDGIWDVMSNTDVVDLIHELSAQDGVDRDDIASMVVEEALRRGSYDNITIIIIWLQDSATNGTANNNAPRVDNCQ